MENEVLALKKQILSEMMRDGIISGYDFVGRYDRPRTSRRISNPENEKVIRADVKFFRKYGSISTQTKSQKELHHV